MTGSGWRNRVRRRGIELASGLLIVAACVFVVDASLLIPGLGAA